MEKWRQGETVTLEAEFKTKAGVLTDPDTHTISVEDRDGNKVVSAQEMSKRITGYWYYKWDIPDDAAKKEYHAEAYLVKDDDKSAPDCWFAVVDRIS